MYEQRQSAQEASPFRQLADRVPGPGILRKKNASSDEQKNLQVQFREEVEQVTFDRHSPASRKVLAFFKQADNALPDIESIDAGQEDKTLAELLQAVEHTMANALTNSKRTGLYKAVKMLVAGLERYGNTVGNKEFSAHCQALLKSHRHELNAIGGVFAGTPVKPSHDIAALGAVITSLRQATVGMTVDEMKQILSEVKTQGGGLCYVEEQLGLALDKLAEEASASGLESPFDTVADLWNAWTSACDDDEVRGHFVRQWWMHSGALSEGDIPFEESIRALCDAHQFDAGEVEQALLNLRNAVKERHARSSLLILFCDIGQSNEALMQTCRRLRSDHEATVEEALQDIATRIAAHEYEQRVVQSIRSMIQAGTQEFKQALKSLPVKHASDDEKQKMLAPLLETFRDLVVDAMDVAESDCRRQVATCFFGSISRLELAVEEGSTDGLLRELRTLESGLEQIILGKHFDKPAIKRALNGVLDMVDGDRDLIASAVTWLAMEMTDELGAAFEGLMATLNTPREQDAVNSLVEEMFKQQTKD